MSIKTNKDQVVFPAQPAQDADTPARKGKRGKVILLSVLGGAVLLTAIGIGAANSGTTTATNTPSATSVAPPTSAAAAAPAPSSAPAPAPAGPKQLVVGQPVTVTKSGKDIGTVVVTSVKSVPKPKDEYMPKPKHGTYWVINVTYTATADGLHSNMFDWKAKDDQGQTFNSTISVDDAPALQAEQLHAGDKATGTVTIDAPTSGAVLNYAPVGAGKSLATLPLVG